MAGIIVEPQEEPSVAPLAGAFQEPNAEQVALLQAYTKARILENEERLRAEIEDTEEPEPQAQQDEAAVQKVFSPPPRPTPAGRSVEVRVSGLGGPVCVITADQLLTVRDVKNKVATASRVPVDQQRLFLGAQELRDQDLVLEVTPPASPVADFSILRADPEWQNCLEMVSIAGMQLAVAPEALRADRVLAMAAVRRCGGALQFAAEELRDDRDVVLAAVLDKGMALEYASKELQADAEVVHTAVAQSGLALQFAAETLRADFEIVLTATLGASQAFEYADAELRADRKAVRQVVEGSGLALEFASHLLRADREIVLLAVEQDGLALEYASEELRSDREVVLLAVKSNGLALWDAAEDLKKDPEIFASAKWG